MNIIDLVRCKDDFNLFKEQYAKNYTYIVARLVYNTIFEKYQNNAVIANKFIRMQLHESILNLLKELEIIGFNYKISQQRIEVVESASKIFFINEDSDSLRGRSLNSAYMPSDKLKLFLAPMQLVETEYPDFYEYNK